MTEKVVIGELRRAACDGPDPVEGVRSFLFGVNYEALKELVEWMVDEDFLLIATMPLTSHRMFLLLVAEAEESL